MSRTVISKFCLGCLIYFLISCTTPTPVSINTTPEEKASTEINSYDLKNFILGTPVPQESKVGGISGCFAAQTAIPPKALNYFVFYNVFRLYNDGTVIGVQVGIEADTIQEAWDKIKVWLNRDNDDLAQGTYHVVNNQIWFDMSGKGHMMAEYYYGFIYNNSMILSSHTQRNGSEEEKDVQYLKLDCASQ
jgi:hypothetical protein